MVEPVTPLFPGQWPRQQPQNTQAEAAVLGGLLHNNSVREQCLSLGPEHFADQEYGRVFACVTGRIDEGRRVDAVSLRGEFDDALLASLVASMVSLQIAEYVTVIRDCFGRRHLIEIAESLIAEAYAGEGASAMAANAAGLIDAIAAGNAAASGVDLSAAMLDAEQAIETARLKQGPSGLSTGFTNIDNRIGGLEPGTLTVVAGRPGMGKSAWGLQVAIAAAKAGAGTLMISLEMSSRELARRVLATAAQVPITAMKYGRVDTDGWGRIVAARRELAGLAMLIEDAAGQTAAQIAGKARAMKRKGLGLVVVDHLHIVRPDDADAKQGATWAVGRISGAMKRLAKDCGVPVLLLAQLNRGVEGRDDKRPGLGDLRQAGDIEQDADAVGFVYRPEYYLHNKPEKKSGEADVAYAARVGAWTADKELVAGKAEIIWGKVRDGESGTDNLRFHGPTTSFSEVE